MRALTTALYATLAADAPLCAFLGTYQGGPSIFTRRPVPVEAQRPVVLAATIVSDVPADLIGASVGRLIDLDVAVYGNAASHGAVVADAAERLKELLHHNRFPVAGWNSLMALARGPVDAPADPQEIGRVVTYQVRLQRFA